MLKPSKKTKRSPSKSNSLNFELRKVVPLTENQRIVFEHYDEGKNLVLCGYPGTGKSLLALYLGIKSMFNDGEFQKIHLIRTPQSTKNIGFLPGDEKMKLQVYETAFKDIVNFLFNRDDAYEIISKKGMLNFDSTSFLRGLTFDNSLIILDEAQNCSLHEISTVISRMGKNSKIIICGDIKQCDLTSKYEKSGLPDFFKIANKMDEFEIVEFGIDDILRSDIVRSFIIAKEQLGL